MATHSSILAWRIPLDREAWQATIRRVTKESDMTLRLNNKSYSKQLVLVSKLLSHSSTLAWKISWTEEPGRLQSMGSLESDSTERLQFHFSLSCIGEGNGNPLQCSWLKNPRDGGAWWPDVYGVAQSWTQLKRLSGSSMLL